MIIQSMPYPELSDVQVGAGAWTWFVDPRAISIANEPLVGAVTGAGRIMAYDSDSTPTGVDLRGSLFQVDDHANPSFLRRSSDGKIIAFATAHSGSGFYTYLSTNADDPSAFGAETNIDAQLGRSEYSYPNPYQLNGVTNDPIVLFYRALGVNERHIYYSISTDQGATFSAGVQVLLNDGVVAFHAPYIKIVQLDDTRLGIFCTDGNPHHTPTNSIYYLIYDGAADQFEKIDGTPLTLPITPDTDLDVVYSGATTRGWIYDCAIDGSGNPVLVYATFPSTSDHRYRYAKWNGAGWTDNQICTAGGPLTPSQVYYSGGVAIDPDNVNAVVASRSVGGAHQLYRYLTANSGAAWSETQMTATGEKCFRPYFVRGQVSEPRLAYVTGEYTSFTSFDTTIVLTDSNPPAPTTATGELHLSGDEQSGTDALLLSGDAQSGTDVLLFQEVS